MKKVWPPFSVTMMALPALLRVGERQAAVVDDGRGAGRAASREGEGGIVGDGCVAGRARVRENHVVVVGDGGRAGRAIVQKEQTTIVGDRGVACGARAHKYERGIVGDRCAASRAVVDKFNSAVVGDDGVAGSARVPSKMPRARTDGVGDAALPAVLEPAKSTSPVERLRMVALPAVDVSRNSRMPRLMMVALSALLEPKKPMPPMKPLKMVALPAVLVSPNSRLPRLKMVALPAVLAFEKKRQQLLRMVALPADARVVEQQSGVVDDPRAAGTAAVGENDGVVVGDPQAAAVDDDAGAGELEDVCIREGVVGCADIEGEAETDVSAEVERSTIDELPKNAVAPMGTAFVDQLLSVLKSGEPGTATQVASCASDAAARARDDSASSPAHKQFRSARLARISSPGSRFGQRHPPIGDPSRANQHSPRDARFCPTKSSG